MFERFTNNARRAIVISEAEARAFRHSFIAPEHLVLGLIKAEGVANRALAQVGVTFEAAREKVAATIAPGEGGKDGHKPPFTPKAKRVLEMSLREALRLGHNYIGTEHILLGSLLVGEGDSETLIGSLGVNPDELRARVTELLASATGKDPRFSAGLVGVMLQARSVAGQGNMTTGQVLAAMLDDRSSQAALALESMGISAESLRHKLSEIPLADTSDAPPRPRAVEIKLGESTTTIDDPELARILSDLSPDEIRRALREALSPAEGQEGSGLAGS